MRFFRDWHFQLDLGRYSAWTGVSWRIFALGVYLYLEDDQTSVVYVSGPFYVGVGRSRS